MSIKIAIIEDYRLTRESLKTILNNHPDFEVVADSKDAISGIELIKRTAPDIVLMDIGLAEISGIEATIRIKELFPKVKVIMLTTRISENEVLASFGAGASGYCIKDITPQELILAIQKVYEGIVWIDKNVSDIVLSYFPKPKDCTFNDRNSNYKDILTKRELDVLKLLVKGQTNSEIADELIVSVHTAKAHIGSILQKFKAKDRVQAAIIAVKERLV